MQRDIAAGIAGELDSQLGAVRRVGAEHGVPTPLLDLVGGLLELQLTRG
jgi:2-dehydropantoate 2-reductase